MSWSLRVWTKAFVCRLKAKLIMRENLTGKLSLDFQENISEIRKLPLSFHFPEEDVNWSEMVILVEFWPKLALYWLYCQLFSVKAKRKKKKVGEEEQQPKKYTPKVFWRTTAMKARVLAHGICLLWGGLNLLKIFSLKQVEDKFLFYLWASHKAKFMPIYEVYCWLAYLCVLS